MQGQYGKRGFQERNMRRTDSPASYQNVNTLRCRRLLLKKKEMNILRFMQEYPNNAACKAHFRL